MTLSQGNQTFTELPATLTALTHLVNAQQPNTQALTTLFARLRPLVTHGHAGRYQLQPGDLTARGQQRPDRSVRGAADTGAGADDGLAQRRARAAGIGADHRLLRPLLAGAAGPLRDFGQTTAYYDANGHYARISPVAPVVHARRERQPHAGSSPQQVLERLKTGQLRRCPGAATQPSADGSSPFTDNGQLGCDPTETPMNPRRRGSLAGSPLLIGALTTLIVVVAVFLSYNANNGLPFVPTYNIKVELPETSGLQKAQPGADRGHARRHHQLAEPPPESRTPAEITAIAELKLEKSVEPLPADTKAIVQSVSAIGLKYLELEKGTSSRPLKAGERSPSHRRANRWTSSRSSTCSTRRRGPRSSTTRSTSATVSPDGGSV